MKRNKYIKWALPISLALLMTGCTDFDELNTDPGKSTDMDPNLQITTVQLKQSNNPDEWHRYFIYPAGFMGQWTNDWATVEYGGRGKKNDAYFAYAWDQYYPQTIKDVVDIVERTRDNPAMVNVHASARILKVQNFLRLTDFYGDIPYFEAGKGYYSGVLKPPYDKQQDIYNDFLKELAEAAGQFNASAPKLSADLFYNGDIDKWKKFANSLRLRIAMRLVKIDPAKAKLEANAAFKAGLMTSNADICFVKHDNVQENTNPSAGNGVANRLLADTKESTFRLAQELIGTMEDLKDPRIRIYGGCYLNNASRTDITDSVYANLGSYKKMTFLSQHFSYDPGVHSLTPMNIMIDGTSVRVEVAYQFLQPSKVITNFGSPFIHMAYAEVEFLLAEAIHRGYIDGKGTADAVASFEKGLRAGVGQWTLFGATTDGTVLDAFIAANPLRVGTELEQINTQLWILHFMDPFETWSNWRRTGLPNLTFHVPLPNVNQTGGERPRRLQYPLDESINNRVHYNEALSRMGGTDSWMNRVWWDKK